MTDYGIGDIFIAYSLVKRQWICNHRVWLIIAVGTLIRVIFGWKQMRVKQNRVLYDKAVELANRSP